jgi:hypothetical protein
VLEELNILHKVASQHENILTRLRKDVKILYGMDSKVFVLPKKGEINLDEFTSKKHRSYERHIFFAFNSESKRFARQMKEDFSSLIMLVEKTSTLVSSTNIPMSFIS